MPPVRGPQASVGATVHLRGGTALLACLKPARWPVQNWHDDVRRDVMQG